MSGSCLLLLSKVVTAKIYFCTSHRHDSVIVAYVSPPKLMAEKKLMLSWGITQSHHRVSQLYDCSIWGDQGTQLTLEKNLDEDTTAEGRKDGTKQCIVTATDPFSISHTWQISAFLSFPFFTSSNFFFHTEKKMAEMERTLLDDQDNLKKELQWLDQTASLLRRNSANPSTDPMIEALYIKETKARLASL